MSNNKGVITQVQEGAHTHTSGSFLWEYISNIMQPLKINVMTRSKTK